MNKAKLIEKLEAWLFNQCPPEFAGKLRMTLVNAKETLEVIRELLEQLDEPKKVIVPACAEPWLEKAQYSSDVISLFSEVEYATDSDGFIEEKWDWSGEFYDWLANDSDTLYILNDAIRYGYEIEKEPEYRIKSGKCYFVEWLFGEEEKTGDAVIVIADSLESLGKAKIVNNLTNAENIARIIGGEVERVEGEE